MRGEGREVWRGGEGRVESRGEVRWGVVVGGGGVASVTVASARVSSSVYPAVFMPLTLLLLP